MQDQSNKLFTATQVRELERIAIEEAGIPAYELMCRAGRATFDFMLTHYSAAKRIAVFCGPGNNGGDGFVIAKLALLANWDVEVICLADPAKLTGPAKCAFEDYRNAGGQFVMFGANVPITPPIVIDALLGTGLTRAVDGDFARAVELINQMDAVKVAVDMPSGLNADTGCVLGSAVKANTTVSFIGMKQGLVTADAPEYTGKLHCNNLDVPDWVFDRVKPQVQWIQGKRWEKRSRTAHKGHFGHLLVVGGDVGYSGAAKMAGEAALRIGAGLVTVATHPEHAAFLNIGRPELMVRGISIASQLADLLLSASVVVLGPGLGQSAWSHWVFDVAVEVNKPLVVDADGLNCLSKTNRRKGDWVLTPHPGEASRLLGIGTHAVQTDRFAAVRDIQSSYGGVVVLKGAGTLVCTEDSIAVSTTGNPGMASGGMGDVLAGVIGGLISQQLPLAEAAQQGVYLHGKAADLAAEQDGERGLLAADLFAMLRRLVN
jgi:ADP-dependent NAD(P)H-hydrate dehydratase / NAD(P)H-hydrate epimerase